MRARLRLIVILVTAIALITISGQVGQVSAANVNNCYSNYGGYYSYPYNYDCNYNSYSYSYPYYGYYYSSPYYTYPYYSSYYGYGNYYQNQLVVNTDPANIAKVTGSGSYLPDTYVSFSVSQSIIQINSNTRYVFSHWSGGYSGVGSSAALTLDTSKTVTAVFQTQNYLTVTVQPATAPLPDGSGWYNAGDTATVTAPAQILSGDLRSRLFFAGWMVDGVNSLVGPTISLIMNSPHTLLAQYKQQYYLTVISQEGTAYGGGWYDAGDAAEIYAPNPPSPSYGVNMIFSGWQGNLQSSSQSAKLIVDKPKTVIATWRTDSSVLDMTVTLCVIAVAASGIGTLGYFLKRRNTGNYTPLSGPVKP